MSPLRLRPAPGNEWTTLPDALRECAAPDPGLDGADDALLLVESAREGGFDAPIACVRVRRAIGLRQPRYWYHVGCAMRVATELNLHHRDRVLSLGNDHTGATELCAIAVDAGRTDDATRDATLQLLVDGALAWAWRDVADGPVDARVIVELPGLRVAGRSPFWHGLGRHFYGGDPRAAVQRHGALWRTHVAALLPQHPLVASLLDADAQAAIGAVPAEAEPLRAALDAAGLRRGDHVTIDEGGAVYVGELARMPAIAALRPRTLRVDAGIDADAAGADACLLLHGDAAWRMPARVDDGTVRIAPRDAAAAGLADGARVDASDLGARR